MSSLFNDLKDGFSRTLSDSPPTHYSIKINFFSLLSKNSMETYESGSFDAGGYKWKIVLYPNGNSSRNAGEYISLYLAMVDSSSLQPGWEVYAFFRLFCLDQNNDNYLIIEDAKKTERRFHGLKKQCGVDKLIPLNVFSDASNGFLVDDTCVFGAEVFIRKEKKSDKGECLSMIKDPINYKHVWRVDNFSKIDTEHHDSREFYAGNLKWKIKLYPTGKLHGRGTHLSLYLFSADLESLSPDSRVFVTFTLRILDLSYAKHIAGTVTRWFSASEPEIGWPRFILLSSFCHSSRGFLVRDTCMVEAELTILGMTGPMT